MVKDGRYDGMVKFIADDLLVFAFFFIPFLNLSPVACGVVFLSSITSMLMKLRWNGVKSGFSINKESILVLSFMAFCIVSFLFIDIDSKQFMRLVFQLRLPFLMLSVAFLFRDTHSFRIHSAMLSFSIGVYATLAVVFAVFIHSLFTAFDNVPYSYVNIKSCFQCVVGLIQHRTYLCFNLLTAFLSFYFYFASKWTLKKVVFMVCLLAVTFVVIFMTEARISLLSFLWVVFAVFIRELKRRMSGWRFYAFLFISLLLVMVVLFRSTRINNIILSLFDGSADFRNIDPRARIWSCGWTIFLESTNHWIGIGSGSAMNALQNIYLRESFLDGLDSRWEMHNQYLEVLVENGFVGFILFILLLGYPLFEKSGRRSFYLIWIPALCVNLFFESMLSRSLGTYSIISVILLSGLSDKVDSKPHNTVVLKIFSILFLVALFCFTVKYVLMDKSRAFSHFQRCFEKVDVLPGNPPSVLSGEHGLKIDNHIQTNSWRNNAYMYYKFDEKSVQKTDSVEFSLYVYASEDFDADNLFIRVEERNQVGYNVDYKLEKRGEWQKLIYSKRGHFGNVNFLITCSMRDVPDFSGLRGFAIFAKPEINIIH